MNKPLVSACVITYNQALFLKQCLDGVVTQNLDIDYEIIIGDDASTDDTQKICEDFQSRFPNKVKYFRRDKNLGVIGNWLETIFDCKGKYIAICEGDDYWTDPFKLQKQVDLFRKYDNIALCFHDASILYDGFSATFAEDNVSSTYYSGPKSRPKPIGIVGAEHFVKVSASVPTCSIMFKSQIIGILKHQYLLSRSDNKKIYSVDLMLLFAALSVGPAAYIDGNMAVYRKNPGGISVTSKTEYKLNCLLYELSLIDKLLEFKYRVELNRKKEKIRINLFKIHIKNLSLTKAISILLKAIYEGNNPIRFFRVKRIEKLFTKIFK